MLINLQHLHTFIVNTTAWNGESILSDIVNEPFSVRPAADDDFSRNYFTRFY